MELVVRQVLAFVLGWLAYASTYLLRKPIGVLKSDIQNDLKLSTTQLGWFDVALLLPYAVAQILLGSLGDKFGSRRVLAFCLIMSGLSMVTFGSWSNVWVLYLLLFLNGLAQSQCWPNCTKILSSWFTEAQKNTVFGLFGTCAFAGGIMGTALAVYLNSKFGWRGVHALPSFIVMLLGLVCFFLYQDSQEAQVTVQSKPVKPSLSTSTSSPVSFGTLLFLPGVLEVSLAVFCLKLVRYCMYMWLPMYLERQLSYESTAAGLFSMMFEIGGVAGSAVLGLLLDRFCSQRPLNGVTFSIVASAVALVVFNVTSGWGRVNNSIYMLIAGAFNCGPDTILGAAIPNMIGRQNGRDCGSAVTGIVNGIGSLGTVLEGPIMAWVSDLYGWSSMFTMMVVLTAVGALATVKAAFSITFTSSHDVSSTV